MGIVKIETDILEIDIEFGISSVKVDGRVIQEMISHLRDMNEKVAMNTITAVNTGNTTYTYNVEADDGREWSQELLIDSYDFGMTHDCPDYWTLSEYTKNVVVRDDIVRLAIEYQLTSIAISWK